ncbi:MAG: hypothetical protein R6W31_14775 [Bacteroidales bacterium]
MKPLRTFIFFVSAALLLLLLAIVFPREGISVNPDIHLKFMNLSDLSQSVQDKDELVYELVTASTVTEDPEEGFELPLVELPEEESFKGESAGNLPVIYPANTDSLRRSVYRIRFAEGGAHLLDPFFSQLQGLLEGSMARTRIMHFGDSQIENDRMTALIRYRLQKQFGGSGTGLVPAIPIYGGNMAFRQEQEGDWLRYTFYGSRDSTIKHNVYGVMGAFTSVPSPRGEQWPTLHYTFNTSRRNGTIDRVRVFMHSYVREASLHFIVNDTITDTFQNIPDGFSVVDYRHQSPIRELSLAMSLPQGGRIYGISFESFRGLQMDNIAMRGGSGLVFTKMNREQQFKMMEYLSPGLIILQYGGNVVPFINAARYQQSFKRELDFMKELCPGVPVIVIGPSDMSMKVKGAFESFPGVEPVRDALKKATLDAGFAFWDLYEAMGGNNSMPSFAKADPPLANSDYIHFSALGINLVAEMFYNALMLEYKEYQSQRR